MNKIIAIQSLHKDPEKSKFELKLKFCKLGALVDVLLNGLFNIKCRMLDRERQRQ